MTKRERAVARTEAWQQQARLDVQPTKVDSELDRLRTTGTGRELLRYIGQMAAQ